MNRTPFVQELRLTIDKGDFMKLKPYTTAAATTPPSKLLKKKKP